MIKRIVVMEMFPEQEAAFLKIFENARTHIRAMPGCMGLELLKSTTDDRIGIWTISLWEQEEDLEHYRTSELFKKTWSSVKPLFAAKARAWTLTTIDFLP